MSERLIFIGPMKTLQVENSILKVLGNALAYMKIDLVISPRGEANRAVIEGYEEFQGKPILKPGKLLNEKAEAFLVYTDAEHELIRALDAALPTWRRNDPEPTIVVGVEELRDYANATLAAIKREELADQMSLDEA